MTMAKQYPRRRKRIEMNELSEMKAALAKLTTEIASLRQSVERLQESPAVYAVQPGLIREPEGEQQKAKQTVRCPGDAYELLKGMESLEQEEMRLVLLNTRNHVLDIQTVFIGTADSSLISPRDIFRRALRKNAVSIIVAHNHPTGDAEPSREDRRVTQQLSRAGEVIGVSLLDHLIIGKGRYVSLKERGVIA